jgi:hypothetical protein
MKRREFIAGLSSAAVWPGVVRAQQRMPTVGLLSGVSIEGANSYAGAVDLIRQGLKDVGFVEGQNVHIEYRSADGHPERNASREAALSSCRMHSRPGIACRSYRRRPETTYQRSIRNLGLSKAAVCSPTDPTR